MGPNSASEPKAASAWAGLMRAASNLPTAPKLTLAGSRLACERGRCRPGALVAESAGTGQPDVLRAVGDEDDRAAEAQLHRLCALGRVGLSHRVHARIGKCVVLPFAHALEPLIAGSVRREVGSPAAFGSVSGSEPPIRWSAAPPRSRGQLP